MIERVTAIALLALLVAGCVSTPRAPSAAAGVPPPMASAFGKPRELIGADARRLVQMFGAPRLDIRDRAVRKLQFANGRCVLDAYLYAPAKGKEPVVTHVDSRLPTGVDTDPVACALALQGK